MSIGKDEEVDFASIGWFEHEVPAGVPGLYRYAPYRSGSHHALHERLRQGGAVPCRLTKADGTVVRFVVRGCPEYGVLDIAFRKE